MTFNPDSTVDNSEYLYRAIRPFPDHWNFEKNRLSSGFYKSNIPISVDREGGRSSNEITEAFKISFDKNFGISKVLTEDCRNCCTEVLPDKQPHNIFHAIIKEKEKDGISGSKAKCLAKSTILELLPTQM
jgi:hypothetical protein